MNKLFQAAVELQDFLAGRKWPFCFIGGMAVLRWGEMRTTQDVDVSLLCDFGAEAEYAGVLLEAFSSRITEGADFAQINRVLLLRASNNVSIDVSLAGLPFEKNMVEQASWFDYSTECSLLTCSAEDLIVLKAFADREVDWGDIRGIVCRQGGRLDCQYITEQLRPLCKLKEVPEIIDKLDRVLKDNLAGKK